jgi:nucleolar protein 53
MLHTLSSTSLKSLRTSGLHKSTLASQRHAASREKLREKLRTQGLKGKRLGKHWVPEGDVDVQLGEDLSESLRELKVGFFVWLLFSVYKHINGVFFIFLVA